MFWMILFEWDRRRLKSQTWYQWGLKRGFSMGGIWNIALSMPGAWTCRIICFTHCNFIRRWCRKQASSKSVWESHIAFVLEEIESKWLVVIGRSKSCGMKRSCKCTYWGVHASRKSQLDFAWDSVSKGLPQSRIAWPSITMLPNYSGWTIESTILISFKIDILFLRCTTWLKTPLSSSPCCE